MALQTVLKSIVFIFNKTFAVFGIAFVVLGSLMMYHSGDSFMSYYLHILAITLKVVGSSMILISLFGIFGSCLGSRCLLLTFCTFLIFLIIVQFLSVLAVFAFYNREGVSKVMISSLKFYNEDKGVKKFWDLVNSNLECCGVNSLDDWGEHLPNSCCKDLNINDVCHKEQAYDKTCLPELEKGFKKKMPIVLSIIGSLQLLAILLAYCLYKTAGEDR